MENGRPRGVVEVSAATSPRGRAVERVQLSSVHDLPSLTLRRMEILHGRQMKPRIELLACLR